MATINSREDQDGITIGWQAIVRKKGYPSQTKTFRAKRDAEAWARIIESEMDRGVWRDRSRAEATSEPSRVLWRVIGVLQAALLAGSNNCL